MMVLRISRRRPASAKMAPAGAIAIAALGTSSALSAPGVLRGGAHRLTPAVGMVFRAVVELSFRGGTALELCGPQ